MENLTDKEIEFLKKNESRRSKCEVFSRVMGYHRPVQYWNDGKQSEWRDRKPFIESIVIASPMMQIE